MVQSNLAGQQLKLDSEESGKGVDVISGFMKSIVELRIRRRILQLVMQQTKSPVKIIALLKELDNRRRQVLGNYPITKLVRVNKLVHWDLYTPAFPSQAFDNWILAEISRIHPIAAKTNSFTNVFFAITKKCSLKCEHCFEWDILNQKEKLHTTDLIAIQKIIEDAGAAQIQLTGGEPILRSADIQILLNASSHQSEYWILSSGHRFDATLAAQLKSNGLHGILISVDHHVASCHNKFRGNDKSFEWARNAVYAANKAHLMTGLTICVTRDYVQSGNLDAYMAMAKDWKVGFVQILEPKAVGHYAGKDVSLTKDETDKLEKFYLKYNYEKHYSHYPIISYHGYHQRQAGCFASGIRNLYIDTDGDINACPFCKTKSGNLLSDGLARTLTQLQEQGCTTFGKSKF